MLENFKLKMEQEGKSPNTINSYILHIQKYLKWYEGSFGLEFRKFYRENILDFKSYLINIEKLKSKSINAVLSALIKLNNFLLVVEEGIQQEVVILKSDKIKIQENFASLADITKEEVEAFRQKVLEGEGKKLFTVVTLLAYTGIRITECISIKLKDFDLQTRELVVNGKGGKERIVFLNDRVVNSLREYLRERENKSEYLFYSRQSETINRVTINIIFNKYSDKITPHKLRHFFCSNAINSGFSIHEISSLAGHSTLQITLLYLNPSKKEIKMKMNML